MKRLILIAGATVNAGAGFYLFATEFNGKYLSSTPLMILLLSVGLPVGIASGWVFRNFRIQDVVISLFPLVAFLGLFVLGSIEKGTARNVIEAALIALLPVVIQGGAWFLTAKVCQSGVPKKSPKP